LFGRSAHVSGVLKVSSGGARGTIRLDAHHLLSLRHVWTVYDAYRRGAPAISVYRALVASAVLFRELSSVRNTSKVAHVRFLPRGLVSTVRGLLCDTAIARTGCTNL